MGGLKPKIAEAVRMFRPRTLKDAISLARMKDEQLQRQRGAPSTLTKSNLSTLAEVSNSTIKKLSCDEMQCQRTLGLFFNYDEIFFVGHKCKAPQLLLLETEGEDMDLSISDEGGVNMGRCDRPTEAFPSLEPGGQGSCPGGG